MGGCWATCMTSIIPPNTLQVNILSLMLQMRKLNLKREIALWPWPHSWHTQLIGP